MYAFFSHCFEYACRLGDDARSLCIVVDPGLDYM